MFHLIFHHFWQCGNKTFNATDQWRPERAHGRNINIWLPFWQHNWHKTNIYAKAKHRTEIQYKYALGIHIIIIVSFTAPTGLQLISNVCLKILFASTLLAFPFFLLLLTLFTQQRNRNSPINKKKNGGKIIIYCNAYSANTRPLASAKFINDSALLASAFSGLRISLGSSWNATY